MFELLSLKMFCVVAYEDSLKNEWEVLSVFRRNVNAECLLYLEINDLILNVHRNSA